ncbi:MAG TPA: hypothetical protein VLW53_00235 [Candidatus Eisenbacteria bacterium]|nr:hypothetical protein [Candidatus Eisenbacteria bacterium]
MKRRGLVTAVWIACLAVLTPAISAAADPGATLTVPAQVQAASGSSPMVQPSFTYPEATPFCTVGVDFTWDGAAWMSTFPSKNGALCVASGISIAAPAGRGGAGAHEICGSAGPRFRDCKTITVVTGQAAPASAAPTGTGPQSSAPARSAPAQSALAPIPSGAPAQRVVTQAVNGLPAQSRVAGLVVLAVGALGLLLILGRRLLLRRRRRSTPLPTPGDRR